MACVTSDEVLEIMNGCTLTGDQIDPYIVVAHTYVDLVFANDSTTTAATKKEIERWYAAHLIASIRDRITTEEKVGEAAIKYAGKFGEGLSSTPYGQMVLQLDTTGKIALSGKKGASIHAVTSFEK